MARKTVDNPDQPLRDAEDTAYHAFREWPVLLMLRQKELAAHLGQANLVSTDGDTATAINTITPEPAIEQTPPSQADETPTPPAPPANRNTAVPLPVPAASAAAQPTQLALTQIEWRGGTQARVKGINTAVAREYADLMKSGVQFPPIVVYHDGQKYWPADGFHRAAAVHLNGGNTISVEVYHGSRRDAILYGITANKGHGLRYSNEDKRNAIRLLLADPDCAAWSDREIARHCGVDHKTVGVIRKAWAQRPAKADLEQQQATA